MNSNEISRDGQFKEYLGGFLNSYTERDKSENFSGWLENKLRQEMPELSDDECQKLTEEIISGVENYNKTLSEVNAAAESGVSNEDWLVEKMEEAYSDMPIEQAGNSVFQIEKAYFESNSSLLHELDPEQPVVSIEEEDTEWSEFKLRSKLRNVAKQFTLNGVAVAANALKNKVEGNENTLGEVIRDTLEDGMMNDPDEVKAVVAGAVRVASEKGLEKILPEETSTETICDIAGAAVEGANAIFDAANGECSGIEALDRTCRAAVAAGCNICKRVLEGAVLRIPYVGSVIRFLLDGLFEHMGTERFLNNVYTVVKDAAIATWNGLKKNLTKIGSKIKIALNA